MRPSILHLRASNFLGGPEKQILSYASSDQVHTIIASFCGESEGTELLREAAERGIATLALPAGSVVQSVRKLKHAVRQSNVCLLCAHGYKPAITAAIVSRLTGVPYVCFLRGWTRENVKVALYEAVERLCARSAQRTVCLSEIQASRLEPIYKSRIRVVVNAANVRHYTAEQRADLKQRICALAGLDPMRPLALAAGRLSLEKGTTNLVEAATILRASRPDVQFVVFGDGVERKRIEQQVSDLGLVSNFKLVGHHRNFFELVAGADLLVNPSLTEEMPNVVMEAMSAGVPVVATAVGGVPELGREGAIELASPGSAKLLAEAIHAVFSDSRRRVSMVENAWVRLQQDYSPERQVEQLNSLYGEFVALRKNPHASLLPRISVVIPVRNEERSIGAVLGAFRGQDYPQERFEILVADGMSTDRTAQIVAQYLSQPGPAIRLVKNPGLLSSCGRNAGVAEAKGEIIVFSDGHCQVPSRTLLRDAADLFACSDAGILCRPQPLNFPGNTYFQNLVAAARASWLGHGRDSTIYATDREGWVDPSSAGAMYRRSLFEQFGGFDECFDACEDVEFNHRLHQSGIKAYISPKLTLFYEPRKTLASLFKQMVRYGRGRVRLSRKHPSAASLAQLVPVALVLLVILLPVMPFSPFFRVWLVLVGAYFGTVMAESARISFRLGASKLPTIALVFGAIHLGLGTGLIIERVTGKRNSSARVPSFSGRSANFKDVEACADSSTSTPQEIGSR